MKGVRQNNYYFDFIRELFVFLCKKQVLPKYPLNTAYQAGGGGALKYG